MTNTLRIEDNKLRIPKNKAFNNFDTWLNSLLDYDITFNISKYDIPCLRYKRRYFIIENSDLIAIENSLCKEIILKEVK